MSATGYDEQATLAALRSGDEAAFAVLVRRHHASMVRIARAYVSSAEVAEEVAQEAWLGVLRGLDRFEGRASLRTWIFRILTNTAKTRGVRDKRTIPFSALEPDDGGPQPERFLPDDHQRWPGHWAVLPDPWPEERLVGAETARRLRRAIDGLPDGQRAVITLRDVEGLTSAEVCNVLELTETNQRVLLHRARTRVRAVLEDYLAEEAP